MRFLKTLLQVLDGTPRRQKIGRQGQSLMEMAIITPLLAIMIAGIVEIGWYANHYMVILEVTRVGARQGTVLQGAGVGPLAWNEEGSIHDDIYRTWYPKYRNLTGWDASKHESEGGTLTTAKIDDRAKYRSKDPKCDGFDATKIGYYNTIACNMMRSLDPLSIHWGKFNIKDRNGAILREEYYPDDIVISLFSLQKIYNDDIANVNVNDAHYPYTVNLGTDAPPGYSVKVVARYPQRANECDIYITDPNPPEDLREGAAPFTTDYDIGKANTRSPGREDMRDPFDYLEVRDNRVVWDLHTIGGDGNRNLLQLTLSNGNNIDKWVELEGYDTEPEVQRGFSWTGQHFIDQKEVPPGDVKAYPVLCFGSEWTIADVEALMNGHKFMEIEARPQQKDFDTKAGYESARDTWDSAYKNDRELQKKMSHMPGQGVILVEMYWHHDTLLNFPFLMTFLNIFGDMQNITISAWAAFPVPAIESNIVYQLPPN